MQVRFHFYDASYEWWWEVDNVLIGSQVNCVPVGGGLVVGNVKDANTNGYVNGAVVTRDDKLTETATTVATPEDTGLADGYYWLYSSDSDEHGFTTKAGNYVSSTQNVNVEADWVTQADFTLAAGRISVTPGSIEANLKLPGGKVTKSVTVKNTGGAPVDVKFGERDGGFEIENADGSTTTKSEVFNSTGAPLQRLQVATSFANQLSGKMAGDARRGQADGGSVDGHRRLPGDRDGQPGRQPRRQGLLDRRWQRQRFHCQQLRLRPGHPGLDRDRPASGRP